MSGRRKGLEAEREAVAALEAFALDVRLVKRRRGRARDVDAVILLGPGRCLTVQIRREEHAPIARYVREHVRRGAVLMYRENRAPWTLVVAIQPHVGGVAVEPGVPDMAEWCDLETFAAYAHAGVLA